MESDKKSKVKNQKLKKYGFSLIFERSLYGYNYNANPLISYQNPTANHKNQSNHVNPCRHLQNRLALVYLHSQKNRLPK